MSLFLSVTFFAYSISVMWLSNIAHGSANLIGCDPGLQCNSFANQSAAIITYTGHGPGYFICYFCSQKDWALRLEWYDFSAKLEPPLVLWLGMALGVTVFCKAWTVILLTRGMALGFIYHIRFSVFWAWPWAAFWAWPWAHIPYTVLCLLGMALGFMLTGPGPGLIFLWQI